jgi:hypothetical protein
VSYLVKNLSQIKTLTKENSILGSGKEYNYFETRS